MRLERDFSLAQILRAAYDHHDESAHDEQHLDRTEPDDFLGHAVPVIVFRRRVLGSDVAIQKIDEDPDVQLVFAVRVVRSRFRRYHVREGRLRLLDLLVAPVEKESKTLRDDAGIALPERA